MAYNLTNLTQVYSFVDLVDELNVQTEYKFGMILLLGISIFAVITMIKSGVDNMVALMGGGIFMSTTSILFLVAGLVTTTIAIPYMIFGFILIVLGFTVR